MANRGAGRLLDEAAFPLKGEQQPREEHKPIRGCFLTPFRCGAASFKVLALVHLGFMAFVAIIALIVCVGTAIVGEGIVLYIGLAGLISILVPLSFICLALFGVIRSSANLTLPLVVYLCFTAVSLIIFFTSTVFLVATGDSNALPFMVGLSVLSLAYLSHAIRVLLRVRIDILDDVTA